MSPMDIFSLSFLFMVMASYPLSLSAQFTPPVGSHITVVGAVYCDTCLKNGFSRHSYFIPGADVHIQCKFKANAPKTAELVTFAVNRTTDNYGVYKLEIPSVDGVDCVEGPPIQSLCQATLIKSPSSGCSVPALSATTNEVTVKSKQENLCVYSFAALSFRPLKKNATLCGNQGKESPDSSGSEKFFLPNNYPWPRLPRYPLNMPLIQP